MLLSDGLPMRGGEVALAQVWQLSPYLSTSHSCPWADILTSAQRSMLQGVN